MISDMMAPFVQTPSSCNYHYHHQDGQQEKKILNSMQDHKYEPEDTRMVLKELQNVMIKLKASFWPFLARLADYETMKKSQTFKDFKRTVAKLQLIKPIQLNQNERLAMFINIYNAMTIHGLLSIEPLPKSILDCHKFWKCAVYRIGGETYSLDDIEHGILRGNRPRPTTFYKAFAATDSRNALIITDVDPRIHFAKCYGAKSSPEFNIYTAENLDEELTEAAKTFCNDNDAVEPDESKRIIFLSKIFRWYERDYAENDVKLIRWLLPFLSQDKRNRTEQLLEELEENGQVRIVYKNFNCKLNSIKKQ